MRCTHSMVAVTSTISPLSLRGCPPIRGAAQAQDPVRQVFVPASLAVPALPFSSISSFGISLRLFRPAIHLSDELACTTSCGSGQWARHAPLPLARVAVAGRHFISPTVTSALQSTRWCFEAASLQPCGASRCAAVWAWAALAWFAAPSLDSSCMACKSSRGFNAMLVNI